LAQYLQQFNKNVSMKKLLILIAPILLFTQCQKWDKPLLEPVSWYECDNWDCPELEHTTPDCPNWVDPQWQNQGNQGTSQCINESNYTGTGIRFSNNGSYCKAIKVDNSWSYFQELPGGDCVYFNLSPGKHTYTLLEGYTADCGSLTSMYGHTNKEFIVEQGKTFQLHE
jgi:hypothetical protein